MVLNDFQRGKIPYFIRPPEAPLEEVLGVEKEAAPKVVQDYRAIRVDPTFSTQDDLPVQVHPHALRDEDEVDDEDDDEDDDDDDDEAGHQKRKRAEEDTLENTPRLSSKVRRRMEREKQQKKAGKHFYQEVNVKNRNR
ncbi:hypothetical protein ACOMHN_038017 [Nucella lapillus]